MNSRLFRWLCGLTLALAFARQTTAQQIEFDPVLGNRDATGDRLALPFIAPFNFDIAGTWQLGPLKGAPGTVWPFPNNAWGVNYSMYGNDRFTLIRTKTETLTYPTTDVTTLRTYYTGAYYHKHATGRATPMAVSEIGSWIGAFMAYDCKEEDFVFPIVATVSLYYRGGSLQDIGFRLEPPDGRGFPRALHPSFFATNVEDNGRNYWSLFQDPTGNLLALDLAAGGHTAPTPGAQDVCNVPLYDHSALFQNIYRETPEGRITNASYFSFFRKVEGPQPTDQRGVIRGNIRDAVNLITITNAQVHLYKQFKHVRPQRADETSQDYARYAEPVIARADTTTIDKDGNFEFKDVPLLFQREDDDGSGALAFGIYAVQVLNAEGDGAFLQDTNNPTIHYKPKFVTNLEPKSPGAPPLIIKVEAESVFAAKSDLIRALTDASANNYAKIEAPVLDFINRAQAGTIFFSSDLEEGLRRGVWAERAVREGVSRADQFIGTLLDGLGTLLADLYEMRFEFASAEAKEGSEFLKKLSPGAGKPINASFNIPAGLNRTDAIVKLLDAGKKFEVYDGVEKALKGLTAAFQSALVYKGMDSAKALYLSDTIHLVLKTIVAAIKSNHAAGATAEFQKILIQELTKQMAPLLLDNSLEINIHLPWKAAWETDQDFKKVLATFPSFPSYAKTTAPSLALSAQAMQAWSSHDRVKYQADIAQTAATIEALNQAATSVAIATEYSKAIAKSGDAIADAVGAIDTATGGNPYAKAAGLVAKVAKWGGNVTTFATPAAFVFAYLPGQVDLAVHQAYGLPMPQGPPPVPGPPVTNAPTATPAPLPLTVSSARSQLITAARKMTSALKTNDLSAALTATTDATNGYLAALATFHRALRQITAQASGLQPTNAAMGQAAFQLIQQESAFGMLSGGFSRQLAGFYAAVLAGDFPNTNDPAYLQARNEVLASNQAMLLQIDTLNAAAGNWQADNNRKPHLPAVMVELDAPSSDTTGKSEISATPETFTIRAHVSNLSSLSLSNLSARLRVIATPDFVTNLGPATLTVANGSLAPLDGAALSGADEANLQWKIKFNGALDSRTVHLTVEVLEANETPVSFVSAPASRLLQVATSLTDSDGDGLPDDYEIAHGLNPRVADGHLDPDKDGLTNLQEYQRHTDPLNPDTDGDGLKDGDEVNRYRTNPLDPDSDGDGTLDGQDGQPLNAFSQVSAPPAPEPVVGVDLSVVRLDANNRSVSLVVSNRGSGSLYWTVKAENPALLDVFPAYPATSASGAAFTLSLPVNYTATNSGPAVTRVRVIDVGGTVQDYVDIVVVTGGTLPGPKLPPRFTRVEQTADGTIMLTISGEAGDKHFLETASVLGAWTPLRTLTNTTGTVQYSEKPATNAPARFYRISAPQ